jgi:O-antigen/teichoic acid export membrane protein
MLKKEVKFRFNNIKLKKHLNAVLILFVSNIAVSIYTMLNTLMLGFMSDYTQVGYYTSAIKISKIILPIVISMSPVIIARINTLKGEGNNLGEISKLVNRSFEYMMMLAIPATIGLIVISPRFVPLFFGTEFIPATISMQLLSLLILIIGINNLFGVQILVGMGYEKKFLVSVLLGTVSSFGLNIILIGPYGSLGSSIASVIAETIVTIAVIIFAIRIIRIRIKSKSIFQPIAATLPVILISLGFNSILKYDLIYLVSTVITSGILYAIIMIFIFKNEQTSQILHSIIKKIRKR